MKLTNAPGFLPSPIHPRRLSNDSIFEEPTMQTGVVLAEVARLAALPVGG